MCTSSRISAACSDPERKPRWSSIFGGGLPDPDTASHAASNRSAISSIHCRTAAESTVSSGDDMARSTE